jgi:hypothetical protein
VHLLDQCVGNTDPAILDAVLGLERQMVLLMGDPPADDPDSVTLTQLFDRCLTKSAGGWKIDTTVAGMHYVGLKCDTSDGPWEVDADGSVAGYTITGHFIAQIGSVTRSGPSTVHTTASGPQTTAESDGTGVAFLEVGRGGNPILVFGPFQGTGTVDVAGNGGSAGMTSGGDIRLETTPAHSCPTTGG